MRALTDAILTLLTAGVIVLPGAAGAQMPVSTPAATSVSAPAIAIIPRPAKVTARSGHFTLTSKTVIWTDARSAPLGRQLARALEPATGWTLPVRQGAVPAGSRIVLQRDHALSRLGREGYMLEVRPGAVTVRAPEAAGIFYGIQSIRQLLPPDIFREAPVTGVRWTMPALTIEDSPRFPWRGAHLDVCAPLHAEGVRQEVHRPARAAEDELVPLAPDRRPGLAHRDPGSIRGSLESARGGSRRSSAAYTSDTTQAGVRHETHGGFYTQDDVREIVAYARQRFVNVVPEIEMPGHAQAAIAAYPWLGNFGRHGGGVGTVGRDARTS